VGHSSPFLFICCQPGAEPLLKDELARVAPALRFAFSRPGLVTFKDSQGRAFGADFELSSVFARAFGVSVGQCKSGDPVVEAIELASKLASEFGKAVTLHVWERDRFVPGEEPLGFESGRGASAVEKLIRERAPSGVLSESTEATTGSVVLDVVLMEEGENAPLWLGFHQHSPQHHPFAGGQIRVDEPEDSPSRAYVKFEQAVRWMRVPLREGDRAVEIGSAPGGASYAMVRRGVSVCGIDPGEMSELLTHDARWKSRFQHVRAAFSAIGPKDLPADVNWVVLDINAPARVSLPYVEDLAKHYAGSLLGVILTLKMNDPKYARHIPEWLERVKEMGMQRLRATQLPANKREICVVGFTKRGVLRLSKQGSN